MSSMDDLVQFITDQLDDDERVARAVQNSRPGPWSIRSDSVGVPEIYSVARDQERGGDSNVFPDAWHRDASTHTTRWDPARVLAEIGVKRRTLALARECLLGDPYQEGVVGLDLLSLLALPYDARPGYREEWRPTVV